MLLIILYVDIWYVNLILNFNIVTKSCPNEEVGRHLLYQQSVLYQNLLYLLGKEKWKRDKKEIKDSKKAADAKRATEGWQVLLEFISAVKTALLIFTEFVF